MKKLILLLSLLGWGWAMAGLPGTRLRCPGSVICTNGSINSCSSSDNNMMLFQAALFNTNVPVVVNTPYYLTEEIFSPKRITCEYFLTDNNNEKQYFYLMSNPLPTELKFYTESPSPWYFVSPDYSSAICPGTVSTCEIDIGANQ